MSFDSKNPLLPSHEYRAFDFAGTTNKVTSHLTRAKLALGRSDPKTRSSSLGIFILHKSHSP
jgi:hypothetical protein